MTLDGFFPGNYVDIYYKLLLLLLLCERWKGEGICVNEPIAVLLEERVRVFISLAHLEGCLPASSPLLAPPSPSPPCRLLISLDQQLTIDLEKAIFISGSLSIPIG